MFAYRYGANPVDRAELIRTRDHMAARGPDGAGAWVSNDERIGFGHRRLAIIDLTEAASQPMATADGSLIVTFNGEIYNYLELKRDLQKKGYIFRTCSDTEVLLHLYAEKGDAMVQDLRGMFAFAIWDAARRKLLLARDPFGIKPLYYADSDGTLRFASQVKALLAGGSISRDPAPAGIVGFYLLGSVPDPFTTFAGIRALPAGHTLSIPAGGPLPEPQPYVTLAAEMGNVVSVPADGVSSIEAVVRSAALNSVRAHLLADVEVGLFLSAGVDSGALLGLMMDAGADHIRTITLGFDDFAGTPDDEVPLARDVGRHYGAHHTVRRVGRAEFEADLPSILEAMDQPSIDGVNTWFVAKAAREAGIKVALSGLGGDELLAGYPSFNDVPRMVRYLRPLRTLPAFGATVRCATSLLHLAHGRPKLAGLAEYGSTLEGAYLLRRGLFLPFELPDILDPDLVREGLERLDIIARLRALMEPDPGSDIGRVAALECGTYTRNQLLRDADWASMAHSLEIRTPLMDIQLLRDIAPVMPYLSGGVGKRALAAATLRPLPDTIATRAKSGFGVPTAQWLADVARSKAKSSSRASTATKGQASRAWARVVHAAQMTSTSEERRDATQPMLTTQ